MENTIEILMAAYNGERFISEQIESILHQTHSAIKLIICDDISNDRTPEIIHQYAQRYPDKIRVVKTEKKLGANQCFSFLLKHAAHKYVMFSDQDDVWLENKVECTLNEMKKLESQYGESTPLLVHSDLIVVDEKLTILNGSFWRYTKLYPSKIGLNRLLMQNVVTGCTVMVNRSAAMAAQPFPEAIVQHDWWLALVVSALGQIRHIRTPLIYYRQHHSNSLGAQPFKFTDYWRGINAAEPQANYKQRNKKQALVLKERTFTNLSHKNRDILDTFLAMHEMSFFRQLYTCIRYRFCYHGALRNLGVFTKKIRQAALAKMG